MRKYITTLLALIIIAFSAAAKGKVDITFDSTEYDFGTIAATAPPVTHIYTMTNTGSTPVTILKATTTCGCTRPDYPKKPVKPGETAKIKVTFIPEGRQGETTRTVKLKLRDADRNTTSVTLKIQGVILPE